MNGEIICVGTELLLGNTINTNASFLASRLATLGINIYNQTVVGDNKSRLQKTFSEALQRSDLVIFSGGLGPTSDDITKESVAEVLGLKMHLNTELESKIEDYFLKQKRYIPKGVKKQALVIDGAEIFKNDYGTAAGMGIEVNNKRIILLPGPPRELMPMFDRYVTDYLRPFSGAVIVSEVLRVYGIGESEVAQKIGNKLLNSANPTVATYAKTCETQVRITASGKNEFAAKNAIKGASYQIKTRLGDYVYSDKDENLSEILVNLLKEKGLKISSAESCTAGMVSKAITDISGSSRVFEMGISAYSNEIKQKTLNVPKTVIDTVGAVSPEVAAFMAKGIRDAANSDIGIGITGVAGPDPSEGKPVGLVYIALTDGKGIWIRRLTAAFENDRDRVREAATFAALDLARRWTAAYPETLSGGAETNGELIVNDSAEAFAIPKKGINRENQTEVTMNDIPNTEDFITETPDVSDNSAPQADSAKEYIASDETYFKADYEKPSILKRISDFTIPKKGDPLSEKIRKTVLIIAAIVFIVAGIYLINYSLKGYFNENKTDSARSVYNAADNGYNDDGMLIRFEELYKKNQDIKGWVRIDGTKVDYPVYQTDDNEFYVTHDLNKETSRYGAIFADSNAKITIDGNSKNVVLYGHNMIDDSMFGSLPEYKNIEYYRDNPLIRFDTLYNSDNYKIFAVIVTNVDKKDDNGYVFNYTQNAFSSANNFMNWIENVTVRSIINTDVDVRQTDSILTLSTCSYEFDNARTVIFARKLRDGESLYVNTSAASYNENPLYPQAYYDKNGGKKPDLKIEYYSDTAEKLQYVENKIDGYTGGSGETYTSDDIDTSVEKKKITVEDYVGLSLSTAIYKINNSGLYISGIEYDGDNGNRNEVLSQSIKAGEEIEEGTGIILKVSGSAVKITVPDFVGMTMDEAREKASETGLTASIVVISSSKPKDTVVMQSVSPKTVVEERSVTIYISNGRAVVPNVLGLTEAKAKAALKKSGFKTKVITTPTILDEQVGIVCKQTAVSGIYLSTGETVTIYVGKKIKNSPAVKDPTVNTSKQTNTSSVSSKHGATGNSSANSKPVSSANTSTAGTGSKPTVTSKPTSSANVTTSASSSVSSKNNTSGAGSGSKPTTSKVNSNTQTESQVVSSDAGNTSAPISSSENDTSSESGTTSESSGDSSGEQTNE